MNGTCALPRLLLKRSAGAKRPLAAVLIPLKMSWVEYFVSEGRMIHSTEVQHCRLFCEGIIEELLILLCVKQST